jgi:hypothetical protein
MTWQSRQIVAPDPEVVRNGIAMASPLFKLQNTPTADEPQSLFNKSAFFTYQVNIAARN